MNTSCKQAYYFAGAGFLLSCIACIYLQFKEILPFTLWWAPVSSWMIIISVKTVLFVLRLLWQIFLNRRNHDTLSYVIACSIAVGYSMTCMVTLDTGATVSGSVIVVTFLLLIGIIVSAFESFHPSNVFPSIFALLVGSLLVFMFSADSISEYFSLVVITFGVSTYCYMLVVSILKVALDGVRALRV